ncbi:hypothetical protein AV530_006583 [Patagioenas fasciata monilis]|uniref:Uncharacterized protein n=1 Tax=Patagioenas fasciata monilis TaxID=372326 RepID=A0A1V4KGZ7_PATFA|nr:hypothetical protein AV530_006583 [Patagioenas fasciata monilis]
MTIIHLQRGTPDAGNCPTNTRMQPPTSEPIGVVERYEPVIFDPERSREGNSVLLSVYGSFLKKTRKEKLCLNRNDGSTFE